MPYKLSVVDKLFAFVSLPFYLPTMIKVLLTLKIDDNTIKQKQQLSKHTNPEYGICFSNPRSLDKLKRVSKKFKCTINDLITLALSNAMYQYFSKYNGSNPPESFHICVPANVRMSHYESEEVVQLENQFTVVPVCLPLLPKDYNF